MPPSLTSSPPLLPRLYLSVLCNKIIKEDSALHCGRQRSPQTLETRIKTNQGSVFKNQDGLQGGTVRTDCQDGVRSIHVHAVRHFSEHRLLARFRPRPPGARRFRSFDKVGRPQLRSHSCASSNVGSTYPSCGLLIYIAEETFVCVHRPVVAANYAAAAFRAAAAAAPDASFHASAAAAA